MRTRWFLLVSLGIFLALKGSFTVTGSLLASAEPSQIPNPVGLGIEVGAISDTVRSALGYTRTGGAIIVSVAANSAAARAGIDAGGIITKINGHPISSPADVVAITRHLDSGAAVAITIWNAGEERLAIATIGPLSAQQVAELAKAPDAPQATAAPTSPPMPAANTDISALPLSSADPIVILNYYTVKSRGPEIPIGMTLLNQSPKTATVIKFLIEIADPFGKIIESDGFQLSGTFAPNVKIDPRDIRFLSDSTLATINANRDISYSTKPDWIFQNRFGPDFYSWQARVVAVRYDDGSVWQSTTQYAFVPRPTPTPGPTVVVQNNDDCGFFSLFC